MRNTGVFSCPRVWFTLPSCRGFVVLSKVFVFAIIMLSVLISGVVAAVGFEPTPLKRLVPQTSMIKASVAHSIAAPIITSQQALQADRVMPTVIVGETHLIL